MTTLNLFTGFVDGQPASADLISENFGSPSAVSTVPSMEILNGWLDSGNWETPLEDNRLGYNSFQVGSLTEGRMVGATLDHDYFSRDFFRGFNEWVWIGGDEGGFERTGPAGTPAEIPSFVTIPGSAVTFYVPYPNCFIVFTWSIRWTHDGIAVEGEHGLSGDTVVVNSIYGEEQAAIRFFLKVPGQQAAPPANYSGSTFVNPAFADNQRRNIGQVNAKETAAPSYVSGGTPMVEAEKRTGGEGRYDFNRHREWSGSYILGASRTRDSLEEGFQIPYANTGVSAGWYEASLRIATSAKQARVQVRSMRYICFKLEIPQSD